MIGNKLAHYEITAHLGSGGMGDVYQANDSKLGRSVAVKELYSIAPDAKLMTASVQTSGSLFEAGKPAPLFQTQIPVTGAGFSAKQQYCVTADGRFLINQSAETAAQAPITILLNWQPK